MAKQAVDQLLLESLATTTSPESLTKGYFLKCRTENKSRRDIRGT